VSPLPLPLSPLPLFLTHPNRAASLVLPTRTQDSGTLATGGYEYLVRLYDLSRPEADPTILTAPSSRIRKLLWAPDGRTVYMGSEDGTLRLWDLASGKIVKELPNIAETDPNKCGIHDMEFNRDFSGLTIACGQNATFVSTSSFTITNRFDLGRDIETLSLHPVHGKTFISGGSDVWVRVHDSETGAELSTMKGHHGKVHAVRFAPSGHTFTSGADDATIRMWRYDEAGFKAPAGANGGGGAGAAPAPAPVVGATAGGKPGGR
jgi:serine-threonine kinase receptor-associated protein